MFIFYLLTDYEGDCQRCACPGDGRILPVSPLGCLVHIHLHSIQVNQHRAPPISLKQYQKLRTLRHARSSWKTIAILSPLKQKLRQFQRCRPITVYQTTPFQTRKIEIDLVMSW